MSFRENNQIRKIRLLEPFHVHKTQMNDYKKSNQFVVSLIRSKKSVILVAWGTNWILLSDFILHQKYQWMREVIESSATKRNFKKFKAYEKIGHEQWRCRSSSKTKYGILNC